MDYRQVANQLLQYIGGEENIKTFTHCATRLRFTLNNEDKVDRESIKAIDDIIGAVNQGGQFQVIIGNDVKYVSKEIEKIVKVPDNKENSSRENEKSLINKVLDTVAGIFVPIVPALAGSGMLKAILAIIVLFGWIDTSGQTYQILNFISDAIFYFLPMLLAHSASVKFGANPYLSITIGGILLHPTFTNMVAMVKESGDSIHLFGLPVTLVNYGSSVIPIILVIWFMSFVEPTVDKLVPKVTRIFSTPLITLFIVAPVALIIIGPLGTLLGDGLAEGIRWIDSYASWLIPMIVGTFTPLLVMVGMHYALISIGINSLEKFGFETVAGPGMLVSNIAQGGAALAVAVRTKDIKLRSLGISTGISAILGITEPALYGVNLPYRKPLYSAMIGGGLGGLFLGIMGVGRYQQVPPGILALPSFIGEDGFSNLIYTIIGIVIAFIGAFAAQLILGVDDKSSQLTDQISPSTNSKIITKTEENQITSIGSPIEGKVELLKNVNDEVFSQGLMGQGVAIIPKNGKVYAPFNGIISVFMESKHAIGIVGDNGVEFLIHCGLDTVTLNGQGFISHIKKGDSIKKGELLLEMDVDFIINKNLDIITPILITNSNQYENISVSENTDVKVGQEIINLK
ncbi:beta-glucoside-specific PTS transporter subunit IIABC [Vagococcus fluvialis]|uniref:beta-glucoside-specific PTS transporter subunit IIABC n=1 Tax=Vagococcus fluvialis TaxID=2738 RepID=UPI001A8DA6FD|nr:PTS glucose transporter subunit IIA [Vagococcus fluvialis]